MYDASNQKLQTLILASTVMFVSLSTVMIQGNLGAQPILILPNIATVRCMAISGAASFFFLFISIVMCVELLNRSARFMMNMSDYQQIKIDKSNDEYEEHVFGVDDPVYNLDSKIVRDQWIGHETMMLKEIRKMRERRRNIFQHPDKKSFFRKSFSQFWTSIQSELWCADLCFYLGAYCMLLATGISASYT